MKQTLVACVVFGVLQFVPAWNLRADVEQDLITILRSNTNAAEKCEACRKLRLVGTAQSVPVLAELLGDVRVSQAARYALEGIPAPEATVALRHAVSGLSGAPKAGVIDSLGWRRDTESVPQLTPLLTNNDQMIASAAAAALGRIGGKEAAQGLGEALDKATPAVKPRIADALLQCAEQYRTEGNPEAANAIYSTLIRRVDSDHVRVAANVGMILAAGDRAPAVLREALAGQDETAQMAALRLAGELEGSSITGVLTDLLPGLSPVLQVGVIGALRQRGDLAARDAVVAALGSPEPSVRVAALSALGVLGDASVVSVLVEAAKSPTEAVQRTARESLVALRHGDVVGALVTHIPKVDAAAQVEIVRALTARNERSAVKDLITLVQSDAASTRKAALQAIANLADASHLAALVDLLMMTKDASAIQDVQGAVESVAERISADTNLDVTPLVKALGTSDPGTRSALLQISALFAHERIREAFRAALKDQNDRIRVAAARALCSTRDPELLPDLLDLARGTQDADIKSMAITGYVRLISDERAGLDAARRAELLEQVFAIASRAQEKKAVLSALAGVADPRSLRLAEEAVREPDVRREAEAACLQAATALAGSNFELAERALNKLAAEASEATVRTNAQSVLRRMKSGWVCTGPYRVAGKQAQDLFDVVFPPEEGNPDRLEWRRAPGSPDLSREGEVDLGTVVGGDHCVVYLKTRVYSPKDQDVIFSIGSDDGIKLWVNGELVHANNAVRGLVPGQDRAKGKLRAGWNDLFVKITQHTLGCGLNLRIIGADGEPIPGIVFDPAGGSQR